RWQFPAPKFASEIPAARANTEPAKPQRFPQCKVHPGNGLAVQDRPADDFSIARHISKHKRRLCVRALWRACLRREKSMAQRRSARENVLVATGSAKERMQTRTAKRKSPRSRSCVLFRSDPGSLASKARPRLIQTRQVLGWRIAAASTLRSTQIAPTAGARSIRCGLPKA